MKSAYGVHSTVELGDADATYTQGEIGRGIAVYARVNDPGSNITTSAAVYAIGDVEVGKDADNDGLIDSPRLFRVDTKNNAVETYTTVTRLCPIGNTALVSPATLWHKGTVVGFQTTSQVTIDVTCPAAPLNVGDVILGFGFLGQAASASGAYVTVGLYKHDSSDATADPVLVSAQTATIYNSMNSTFQAGSAAFTSPETVDSGEEFSFNMTLSNGTTYGYDSGCGIKTIYLILGKKVY